MIAPTGDIRRPICACLALVVVTAIYGLASPFSAQAREMLHERFDRIPQGVRLDNTVLRRDGSPGGFSRTESAFWVERDAGNFLDAPVAFGDNAIRGAISFDLQRKQGAVPSDRRTVFELLDAQGVRLFFFQVQWTSEVDPRRPMVHFRGPRYWAFGRKLWPSAILLDREVAPGQWIRIDIAWDDAAGKYALFVDGRPQDTSPNSYRVPIPPLPSGRVVGRRAENIPQSATGDGPPISAERPFGFFLSQARSFRFGLTSRPPKPAVAGAPLSNAVLDNFTVLAGEWPAGITNAPRIRSVTDDSFRVAGISGKLVAGDKVTVELKATPGGKATFDMGDVRGVAMEEVPPTSGAPGIAAVDNGTYRGSYVIRPGDDFENGRIVGNFVSHDNIAASPVVSPSKWTIDTKPVVSFSIDRKDLPADSVSKARIRLVAKDANGNPVKGRHLKLTLATTNEYTGTVGAGDFGKVVGAVVETRWRGETDSWGEVEFDYKAGFAAKTVLLTAKDLDSGGVSVDYLTSYKEASIDIALTPPVNRAAARRGARYILKVEATRTELTADGRSRSVIRATLLDPNGKPVAGDPVAFSLSSGNGSVRTISGTTDSSGVATAEYIAGKKIGIVVVTATATLRNAAGTASITLLSDAPAKVILTARPATLPADGNSRADLLVKVTDINDNPNRDTKVEFRVTKGSGKLDSPDRITDRFGDARNRYTAGAVPGIATVLATVRSKVPTEAELLNARNILFAPYSPEGEEIRVERWLKKKGETALKGEPVVAYSVGRNREPRVLLAPVDLIVGEIFVEYWDTAEVGQSLAQFTPAVAPGGVAPQNASGRGRWR